jgi:hypothetical protein
MTNSNAAHPAYIGRSPCGCITFATVDTPEHKCIVAKEVAQAMRDGLTIERVTVQFVRLWIGNDLVGLLQRRVREARKARR